MLLRDFLDAQDSSILLLQLNLGSQKVKKPFCFMAHLLGNLQLEGVQILPPSLKAGNLADVTWTVTQFDWMELRVNLVNIDEPKVERSCLDVSEQIQVHSQEDNSIQASSCI